MDNHSLSPPREAYGLPERNDEGIDEYESIATSSVAYSEFQRPHHSTHSGSHHNHPIANDETDRIHEMHLCLLYLMSHPEEFELPAGHSLSDWHDNDTESLTTAGTATAPPTNIPLPCRIFADDAEVVLPQAHTASQLFGSELDSGMELEAAAGIVNICRLFRRFTSIFPDADHLHLISPPGITVMKIIGNRYRVTAAHECFWTWQHQLSTYESIQLGELVRLRFVDVFETDRTGRILSYCPTFDNRNVEAFDRNLYRFQQHTKSLRYALEHSPLLQSVRSQANQLAKQLKEKVDTVVYGNSEEPDDASRHSIMGVPSYCLGQDTNEKGEQYELHEA